MDDLRGLMGVTLLRSFCSSADCGLSSTVTFLFLVAPHGDFSQWTCAGDDASLCVGDIGDTSILLSPSFADDRKLTDLSETAVLLSKVCARL